MRIGVIGAGQLGQMLGFAGRDLGIDCRFLDPSESPPANTAGEVIRAEYTDVDALLALAKSVDVVTYEFENVSVDTLEQVAGVAPVYPPPSALLAAQDRASEKSLFAELDVPLAPYRLIASRDDLEAAVDALGLPLIVKTRRFGYDGKGQFRIGAAPDVAAAWRQLDGRPAVAEAFVDFDYEVSVIGARGTDGSVAVWPLTKNEHADGILRCSVAPVEKAALLDNARGYVERMLSRLDYVGVLALELFVRGGELLANEFAPRVHNSGHWTIEGAATSQFANHLLAVTGRPLGATESLGHAGMLNLIGEIPAAARDLAIDNAVLHDYGKAARPGRKLGHITVVAETAASRDRRVAEIREILAPPGAV